MQFINLNFFSSADVFTIDELAVYEGTLNDQTYAVSGDVLDGVIGIIIACWFSVTNLRLPSFSTCTTF